MIRITKELNGNITRELAQSSDGTGLLVTNILPDGSRRDFKITEEALVSSSNIVEMLRLAAKNILVFLKQWQRISQLPTAIQARRNCKACDSEHHPWK